MKIQDCLIEWMMVMVMKTIGSGLFMSLLPPNSKDTTYVYNIPVSPLLSPRLPDRILKQGYLPKSGKMQTCRSTAGDRRGGRMADLAADATEIRAW
jgi:hypothetical protein